MKLIGDLVHDVATFLGFEECSGCKKRRKKLNEAHARARLKGSRKAPCAECKKVQRIG